MKRPRKFLAFILVLLLINTLFFVAWYALDLQGTVKGIVEREAGKALKGKLHIASFTISDQQVFAQDISFKATDNSLNFVADNARIRFNLLRFIFSGFRIRNILNHVELNKADISYNYVYTPKPRKAKKKFELPDLRLYFNDLKLTDSRIKFHLDTPLNLIEPGNLVISEELSAINLNVKNSGTSRISLSAVSSSKGSIFINAVLDKGRLVSSHAEINNLIPQYINHPQFQNASTELNLVLDAAQEKKGSPLSLDGKAILWDTNTLLFSRYPVRIPYLTISSDGNKLVADISQVNVGSSSLAGTINLSGLMNQLKIEPTSLALQLDLSMLDPKIQGIVDATLNIQGTLKDPVISLSSGSQGISYKGQSINSLALDANFASEELAFNLQSGTWQNQSFSISGVFDTKYRKLIATLDIQPVNSAFSELKVNATADLELTLYEALPEVKTAFTRLDIARGNIHFANVAGYLNLFPASQGEKKNYYVDLELVAEDSTKISLVGDLLDRTLLLNGNFNSLALANIYPQQILTRFAPVISGEVSAFMDGNKIVASSDLDLAVGSNLNLSSDLKLNASYDLQSQQGFALLQTSEGSLNGEPISLDIVTEIERSHLKLYSLQLNDQILLSGDIDLKDYRDSNFDLVLKDFSSTLVTAYYPQIDLPEFNGVDLLVNYHPKKAQSLGAEFILKELKIPGLRPLQARFSLQGQPEQIQIAGILNNQVRTLVSLSGTASLQRKMDLQFEASVNQLAVSDLMESAPASGTINGVVGVDFTDLLGPDRNMTFVADINSPSISIPDIVDLDNVLIKVTQTSELLTVDTLYVSVSKLASVQCSGALDYNILTQSYFEGDHKLDLKVEGDLFAWLNDSVDIIKEARGKSKFACTVKTLDDQFLIEEGNLDIENGFIALKDQSEAIRSINLKGVLNNNQLRLEDGSCVMGDGKLTFFNEFDEDPSNHFFVAFLDLGSFKVRADEPGLRISLPLYTEPRSTSNIVLRGQNTEYATITGPFDDMRISAEALVYNANAVYPPNTDNLLNLIYSFRSAFARVEERSDPVPLPFNLDLMIRLKDNVKYSTYPANMDIQPDGYLHIIYDGLLWRATEASFYSDRGSIDFFGTVFQADNLTVTILESQDILDVEGSFFRRAEDGTIITLSVHTDSDASKPIFDRLVFSLSSDNPDDLTISNVITRLRYKSNAGDLSGETDNNVLRDEALNLISDNLNTSLVAPFLLPVENTIRRLLKLDDVSINAGFFQNLFTEYSSNTNQVSGFTDVNQFMGDVARFSSSILLNNLSVSVSKYLGRKLYLDYKITLQEATDLQNQTRITVSHDTSLRLFLPQQFRVAYTFKYEHEDNRISHEIMLMRSFRFWGL